MTARRPRLPLPAAFAALGLLLAAAAPAAAQTAAVLEEQGYLSPPDEIEEALLAPWHLNVDLDDAERAGRWFVVEERSRRMPPLAAFAREHRILGGLQVDVRGSRERGFATDAADGLRLLSWEDGGEVAVEVPAGATVSDARFTPDGSRLAFFAHFDDATHVYVADPESGASRRVTPGPVLATLVTEFAWAGDGRSIFTVLVPEGRGAEPTEPSVAATPGIWHTEPEENELRTYPSLLETPHEFALLEHHTVGQLARIDVETGEVRRIGEPAMIELVDPSPDGEYVRVRTIREPYSDIVAVRDFATVEEVWDLSGRVLAEVAREAVDDGADEDGAEDGRRLVAWLPGGADLGFVRGEPAPEGGDESDVEDDDGEGRTDHVVRWLPPFGDGDERVVHESGDAVQDVVWTADASRLFVTTEGGDVEHLYAVAPGGAGADTVYSHDTDDFYADPGELMTRRGPRGGRVALTSPDGGAVHLAGTVHHEEPLERAPQPFVDRVALATGETTRVFESAPDRHEEVAAVLDDDFDRVVLQRQSPTEVPDFFVRDLASGDERRLTDNRDPTPELTSRARRHVLEVERADGVTFWVRITLPADYEEGTRLPAMFWHYPREFDGEEAYAESNRDYNRNAFPAVGPRSMEHLLLRGWAVVEPDVPIIGPSRERWNDYYTAHLRNSFAAAIDALDERGWIDRSRLAVGGHSYGGFGTINTMIHTPFFKAGIAGASNTNRTLTPAGFQREPRTLWEGRETYIRMSPMFWLNELTGALLMYHDMEDQNVGTFPVNSWRAFHGLNALGKTASLYMYPYEGHGPRAEETILDLWTRWTAWLDQHVLGQGPGGVADAGGGAP